MKKFITAAACVLLSATVIAAAGCGNTNKGAISGNYKEPSQEELNDALESIDYETAFGQGLGFQAESGFELSVAYGNNSISASEEAQFKAIYDETKGLIGAGSLGISYSYSLTENGIKLSDSQTHSAEICLDSSYAYISFVYDKSLSLKAKLDYTEVAKTLIGSIGQIPYGLTSQFDINIADLIELANEFNIDIGLDTSKGLKFKFSLTEETVWSLLRASEEVTEEEITEIKQAVTFNTFKIDAYAAFDKAGVFAKTTLDVDLDVTVGKAVAGEDVSLKINGYESLEAYEGKVTLPDGIANDANYVDYTQTVCDYLNGIIKDVNTNSVAGKTYVFKRITDVTATPDVSALELETDLKSQRNNYADSTIVFEENGRYTAAFNDDTSLNSVYVQSGNTLTVYDSPFNNHQTAVFAVDGDTVLVPVTINSGRIQLTLVYESVETGV